MPVIPFIQSERTIPGTSGGVYAPSEDPVSAAIVRSGALATKEADQFMGVLTSQKHWEDAQARAEQNAQRHVEALTFGHDLKNDVDTIAESYKGRTDYQKFEEDGQSALDALKAKYDGAITDPVVKRVFLPTFLQESYNLQKTIRDKKNEVLTEAGKGQWIIERDQALNNWVNAGTPEEKQVVADQFELTTQALVVGRILKPAEAENAIKTFKNHAAEAYFRELVNTDATRAFTELSDKGSEFAKLLDPVMKQQLFATAERKAGATQEDTAYAHVFQKFSLSDSKGDYVGAIRELRNPTSEVPAIKSMTAQQRNAVESMVRGQEAYNIQETNRIATEGKNKDLDSAGETFLKGNVKEAIRLVNDSEFIPGMDKKRIIEDMQKPAPEGKSNSSVYLDGAEKMYDPSLPLAVKKVWLLKNRSNLNITDYKHFSNIGMSQERTNDKAAVKSGIDTIKAALTTPGFSSQAQKERLDRAIKLYESGTEQYKAELNTPDKIKAYANSILKMTEFTNVNPIADMKADMAKIRGRGLGSDPVAIPEQPKTKTVTIDGRQYRDGDIITKDGQRFKVKVH